MLKISVALLVISLGQSVFAMDCVINPSPLKVINKCGVPRSHGGEVSGEDLKIGNKTFFGVTSSPQTYQHLYLMQCKDTCGNEEFVLGDIYWDCVGPQEVAGMAIEQAQEDLGKTTCAEDTGPTTVDRFQAFLNKTFSVDGHEGRPSNMPAPALGVNYWYGDDGLTGIEKQISQGYEDGVKLTYNNICHSAVPEDVVKRLNSNSAVLARNFKSAQAALNAPYMEGRRRGSLFVEDLKQTGGLDCAGTTK